MRHRLTAALLTILGLIAFLTLSSDQSVAGEKDLKTLAAETGLLNRMTEIKKLAGLDGAGANVAYLTIFAPSDAAFEALPANIREKLLAPENKTLLADVLMHHAVIGYYSTRILRKAKAKHYGIEAVDGTLIEFTTRKGVDVSGAKIVKADIRASNGVLHVIDKVLIPDHIMAKLEGAPPDRQLAAE